MGGGEFLFVITIFFFLLPLLISSIYAICEHKLFTDTTFFLILQSNISEALRYVYSKISLLLLIGFSIYIILLIYLIVNTCRALKNSLRGNYKSLISVLSVFILISCSLYTKAEKLLFLQSMQKGFKLYDEYRVLRQPDLEHLQVDVSRPSLGKHLIVVGESSNRDYWGLYNSLEKTTPGMDRVFQACESCTYIQLAYSTEKMTETSLAKTLTNYGQRGAKTFSKSYSIIDLLNKLGYETYWFSNQNVWGNEKSSFNSIGLSARYSYFHSPYQFSYWDERPLDSELIEHIEKIDFSNKSDMVVFVHLMGSHAPYKDRYDEDHNMYEEDGVNSVGAYKNSILYTDSLLERLYKVALSNNFDSMIYFSDHGELPGVGRDSLSIEMFKVPVLFMFTHETEASRRIKENNRKQIPFTLDMLFSTLIGIFDLKTNLYFKDFDYTKQIQARPVCVLDSTYCIENDVTIRKKIPHLNRGQLYDVKQNREDFISALKQNWYQCEDWGCWSKGRTASLSAKLSPNTGSILLELVPLLSNTRITQSVELYVNKKFEKKIDLSSSEIIELKLKSNSNMQDEIEITIDVDKSISPKKLQINDDDRDIGIGLRSIRIK